MNLTQLDPATIIKYMGRTGRWETWAAASFDGRWSYGREDDTTTPWIVTDRHAQAADPINYRPEWFGTLRAARRWTATQERKAAA